MGATRPDLPGLVLYHKLHTHQIPTEWLMLHRVVQAPVFSKLPRFPAVLGQFLHTFDKFGE